MDRQRGSTMVVIAPLALLTAAMILLGLTETVASLKGQETRRLRRAVLSDARTALARAQGQIKNSAYGPLGNVRIRDAIANGDVVGTTEDGRELRVLAKKDNTEVWISAVSDSWFQLDAVARIGRHHAHVRCLVRENDSWARYYAFSDQGTLGLSGSANGGAIHSNQGITFHGADGEYLSPVTSANGFSYADGATPENTYLAGGSAPAAPTIAMPNGAISERAAYNTSEFHSAWSTLGFGSGSGTNPAYYDADPGSGSTNDDLVFIELKGDSYDLIAYDRDTGAQTGIVQNIPLPSTGVLFIPTDISGLKGTVNGRLTIATNGSVTLTGSIQYVDAEGDTAYLNGIPSNPATDPYEPNPDYNGTSALGILARGDITYALDAPAQMEHNAYFYSATGSFGLPSSGSYGLKTSLRRLGGVAVKYNNVGAITDTDGNIIGGFADRDYVYDRNMALNPPPHFLELDQPAFTAFRVVLGTSTSTVSGEQSWDLRGVPIGGSPALNDGVGLITGTGEESEEQGNDDHVYEDSDEAAMGGGAGEGN